MRDDIEVSRKFFGYQTVRGPKCVFRFVPLIDDRLLLTARLIRDGEVFDERELTDVRDWHSFRIHEAVEGRESYAGWPLELFYFVRQHIADAMLRDRYPAHEAIAVVRAMDEAEAKANARSLIR